MKKVCECHFCKKHKANLVLTSIELKKIIQFSDYLSSLSKGVFEEYREILQKIQEAKKTGNYESILEFIDNIDVRFLMYSLDFADITQIEYEAIADELFGERKVEDQ